MFFPYIFTVLTFSTASPSIYGNIHWTLKTSPNIITNHLYFFSDFSPIFLLFLHLVQLYLLHMEMCNGPWKQHHTPFSFLFFLLFYLFVNAISFMEMCTGPWNDEIAVREWSCYWNEKWNVLWLESKRMKEISFSCCWDLEWNRCHEWMKIHFIHSR